MLEQFFECAEKATMFMDYEFHQEWAELMLNKGKFVWAVTDEVLLYHISVSLFSLFLRASEVV